MSKRITINVPEDIAEYLAGSGNASAYATESIRRRIRAEATHSFLRAEGFAVTDEGVARARARMRAAAEQAAAA